MNETVPGPGPAASGLRTAASDMLEAGDVPQPGRLTGATAPGPQGSR
ncbi:MAG: hypothetical protein JWL68_6304, partial [Actinomycetia bacterium]|nr:hypothetical protein [Actinomycetes bacterium]